MDSLRRPGNDRSTALPACTPAMRVSLMAVTKELAHAVQTHKVPTQSVKVSTELMGRAILGCTPALLSSLVPAEETNNCSRLTSGLLAAAELTCVASRRSTRRADLNCPWTSYAPESQGVPPLIQVQARASVPTDRGLPLSAYTPIPKQQIATMPALCSPAQNVLHIFLGTPLRASACVHRPAVCGFLQHTFKLASIAKPTAAARTNKADRRLTARHLQAV